MVGCIAMSLSLNFIISLNTWFNLGSEHVSRTEFSFYINLVNEKSFMQVGIFFYQNALCYKDDKSGD